MAQLAAKAFLTVLTVMTTLVVALGAPSSPKGSDFNINGIRLGMSRVEVADKLPTHRQRRMPTISGFEHFGQVPGYQGAGNATWVKFDEKGTTALTVEGFNLFLGSKLLADESSSSRSVRNSRWFVDLGNPIVLQRKPTIL